MPHLIYKRTPFRLLPSAWRFTNTQGRGVMVRWLWHHLAVLNGSWTT